MELAAFFGATGVTLGAFGAHLLKSTLEARGTLPSWKTAVEYQLIHSVALLALSLHREDHPENADKYALTAQLWTAGIVLFSGSIYGLSLGGPRLLGPVTPLGGLCLIAGWLSLLRSK
jgi:uncharacterized membrane protein YgdD (TMEM256/DUF423 family)